MQEYWPTLLLVRGLIVRVEMNGDLRLEGGSIVTLLSLDMMCGVQSMVTLTSVSTDEGRVTVQIRV